MDILRSIKVSDALPPSKKIIMLTGGETIHQAFKVLVENNILSCPVIHEAKNGSRQIKLIDIADLVKFVVDLYSEDDAPLEHDINVMMAKAEQGNFKIQNVVSLANLADENQSITVAEGADLAEIAVLLARGLHRVIVVDKGGAIVNFITQSALLDLIVKHKQYLGELLKTSLFELKIGIKDVVTVGAGETAYEAFKLIATKKISAVAIIDGSGKIVGNISVRDLRTLARSDTLVKRLFSSCSEFLKTMQAENGAPVAPIVVHSDDLLDTVMEKLKMHKIHRVYIVNNVGQPVGVMALKDLLDLLVRKDDEDKTKKLAAQMEAARHPMGIL